MPSDLPAMFLTLIWTLSWTVLPTIDCITVTSWKDSPLMIMKAEWLIENFSMTHMHGNWPWSSSVERQIVCKYHASTLGQAMVLWMYSSRPLMSGRRQFYSKTTTFGKSTKTRQLVWRSESLVSIALSVTSGSRLVNTCNYLVLLESC